MFEKRGIHEIVRKVAYDMNFPYEEAWALVGSVIDEVSAVLDDGDDVSIRNLGVLYWQELPGGTYFDASKNERRAYPSGFKIRFKPAVKLSARKIMHIPEDTREAEDPPRKKRSAHG